MQKFLSRMFICLLAALGLAATTMSAWAAPFQFTYRTRIELSTIAGISDSDEVVINVRADNGGTSSANGVWNEADLLSATLTAGSYTARYDAPLLAGLDPTFGTDSLGGLERAVFLGGVIGLNSDSFGVGGAIYLFDDVFLDYFGNPAILRDALSDHSLDLWSGPTAVPVSTPEPSMLLLVALGALAFRSSSLAS